MPEDQLVSHDVRFCPYCFQQGFEVQKLKEEYVFCEICGIDVEVKELVKQ